MLSKLKITQRIFIAVLVPLIGFLFLSTKQLYQAHQIKKEMVHISELGHFAPIISELVHELQKERGMSAGFIGSKGKILPINFLHNAN